MVTDTGAGSHPGTISPHIDSLIDAHITRRLDAVVGVAVQREEKRRFRQLSWFTGLIGVIGLGTIGTVSNMLIDKAVDSRLGSIRQTLELARFNSIALKLGLEDFFSPEDQRSAMALLRRIARNEDVRDSVDFTMQLKNVVKAFVAAGNDVQVDELMSLYWPEISKSSDLVQILLHNYGQRVISRAVQPRVADSSMKSFEKLEQVSTVNGSEDLALYYRVLLDFKDPPGQQDETNRIVTLLERTRFLSQADAADFLTCLMDRTRASNWSTVISPSVHESERLSRAFLLVYSKELGRIFATDPAFFVTIGTAGIERKDAQKKADEID